MDVIVNSGYIPDGGQCNQELFVYDSADVLSGRAASIPPKYVMNGPFPPNGRSVAYEQLGFARRTDQAGNVWYVKPDNPPLEPWASQISSLCYGGAKQPALPPGTIVGQPRVDPSCSAPVGQGQAGTPAPVCLLQPRPTSPPPSPPPPKPSPPPSPPPPSPPPGCVIDPSVPAGYTSSSYSFPAQTVALTGDLAGQYTDDYPWYVLWVNPTTQIAYVDATGLQQPPTGQWFYKGTTSLQALQTTSCHVYVGLPPPPPPPPQFPGCDTTTYIAIPVPGSEDWCRLQDQILGGIRAIGIEVFGFVSKELQSLEKVLWDWRNSPQLKACGLTSLLDCLAGAAKWVVGNVGYPIVQAVHQLICWVGNGAIRSDTCDPITYGTLIGLKMIWTEIKNSEIGINFMVEAKLHIGSETHIPLIDRVLDYLIEYVCPTDIPGVSDAIEAYLTNRVGLDQFKCWLGMRGAHPTVWQSVIDARREQLTTDEIIEYTRRQSLGDQTAWEPNSPYAAAEEQTEEQWQKNATKQMRNVGWLYQQEASNRYQLYDELPTIADHLHWLSRNVDDTEYVAKYHLLDGFSTAEDIGQMLGEPDYAALPQAGARNFWATFGAELRAQGMRKIDAARHYAAHWLHGSPQQMREFVFRLIPGRPLEPWEAEIAAVLGTPAKPGDPAPPNMSFTADDFRRLLAEQDYGYLDVGWFLSTLYHVPALSYLRDMYRYGVIKETDLQLYHQKLGYSPGDSERFVAVDALIKARIRAAEAYAWTPSALSRAYGLGLITKDFYQAEMKRQGFTDKETASAIDRASKLVKERTLTRALGRVITRTITQVSASYSSGVLDAQTAVQALKDLGVPKDQANAIVQMEALKTRTKLTTEAVRVIRSAYLKGKIDQAGAENLLRTINLSNDYIRSTLATWAVEKIDVPKEATLADIKRWVVEGLMSFHEAQVRLTNLGYKDAEQHLILAELRNKIDAAEARAQANLAKEDAKAKAEAARAVEQAQRQLQQAVEKIKTQMPPAKLVSWVRDGIISVDEMAQILATYGFTQEAIMAWTSEAVIKSGQLPAIPRLPLPPPKPPKQKTLTEAQVLKLYKQGIIDPTEFVSRLSAMGYNHNDISELAQSVGQPLPSGV